MMSSAYHNDSGSFCRCLAGIIFHITGVQYWGAPRTSCKTIGVW